MSVPSSTGFQAPRFVPSLPQFLEILGFRRVELVRHQARHIAGDRDVPLYTMVAHR